MPYAPTSRPQELLTQANAILGQGQMSLAKYLWIIDQAADESLEANDIERFLVRCLDELTGREICISKLAQPSTRWTIQAVGSTKAVRL